jgi:hypothetical protein
LTVNFRVGGVVELLGDPRVFSFRRQLLGHGDGAFLVAATNGVRQHHWSFGNMPPVEGITQAEVKSIVTYVREVQRANGID